MKKPFRLMAIAAMVFGLSMASCSDEKDKPEEPKPDEPGTEQPTPAVPVEGTSTFTYAGDDATAWGLSYVQRYDVAMAIDNSALKGNKISAINAYISSAEGFGSCSIWMTKTLNLDNEKNVVADIFSVEVTPTAVTYAGQNAGLLSYTLPEPYEYDGSEIWIGYSVMVPALDLETQKQPLMLSDGINDLGFWIHGTRNPLQWVNYSSRSEGVAIIKVDMDGLYYEDALNVASVDYAIASVNNPFEISVNVMNTGSKDITSFDYAYEIEGNKFEGTVNLKNPIEPNIAQNVAITIPCEPLTNFGLFDYVLSIPKINGVDNNAEVISANAQLGVLQTPMKNRPLVEEYTGLWCGWCPRGFQGMEELGAEYGDDVVIACYHNADPMAVTNNYPIYVPGYPLASINRMETMDPYFGTSNNKYFGISDDVANYMKPVPICDINVKSFSIDGNMLTVKTESSFAQNISDNTYRVGYVLTANGLSNDSWGQANYMAQAQYASSYKDTPLGEWTTRGVYAYGLIFNDVVVNVEGMGGIANSLPSEIEFGKLYETEFSLKCQDIKSIYTGSPAIDFNIENAVINVFIVNPKTGEVLNANKLSLIQ